MSNWRRRSNSKPGIPFIPDRKELNEQNIPLREAAAKRRKTAKAGKK